MKKTNNRGVSLIEILIAVVVFAMCVTPIVFQLTTSIRIGNKAEDQQAATDYGKSITETMKQMELQDFYSDAELISLANDLNITKSFGLTGSFYSVVPDTTDPSDWEKAQQGTVIPAGSYLNDAPVASRDSSSTGIGYQSVSQMYQKINQWNQYNPSKQEALVRQYVFTGETNVDHRDYEVTISMDTKPYAIDSLTKTNYTDPNSVNLGNLSSLDSSTTAVITRVSNYDMTATAAFFNATVSALEQSSNPADVMKAVQIKNGNAVIGDSAQKKIQIQIDPVTDPSGNQYEVICSLTYIDSDPLGVLGTDKTIEYVAFQQKFKRLPEVYLMYNQFLYNTVYGDDEISIVNNTGEDVKVFVVRTAETNDDVKDLTDIGSGSFGSLVPTATTQGRDDMNGSRYLYRTEFNIVNSITSNPVTIYTNIPLTRLAADGVTELPNITNSSSTSVRNYKMCVNASDPLSVVKSLDEDERYSEQGRMYHIVVTLKNVKTGNVTTFDSSKGDY